MICHILKPLLMIPVLFMLFASPATASSTVGSPRFSSGTIPEFTFQIPIPGASRTFQLCEPASGGTLSCPGIGLYITWIYKWLVGFAVVLAVLALTWGGVQWLISGGESGKIQEARKVIGNAVIGLLLALGSYGLLATIGKDYVNFQPIRVVSTDPIHLKIAALATVPPTSSIATRAGTTTRTALPSATVDRTTFEASCQIECTNRGTVRGTTLTAVVTESGGLFECNCKEASTGAVCNEPDTELSRQATCSDVCPIGSVIPPGQFVLKVKDNIKHTDAAGKPFYCCSCYTTSGGTNPTCGSKKDQQCCGVPGGEVVCKEGLYPVKKSSHHSENKCFCYAGNEGAVCNAVTGLQCGPGLRCKTIEGFFGISFAGKEDGECKK